jgi:hypothetical protein
MQPPSDAVLMTRSSIEDILTADCSFCYRSSKENSPPLRSQEWAWRCEQWSSRRGLRRMQAEPVQQVHADCRQGNFPDRVTDLRPVGLPLTDNPLYPVQAQERGT